MKKFLLLSATFIVALVSAQSVVLSSFATGFTSPVEITHANDSRLFVVQQNGIIRIVQPTGAVNSTNFLNISSKITFSGEQGLLGLAFHPQYALNGYFFVFYNNTAGAITVARYTVSSNADVANAASEKVLLTIPKPFTNHNGGSIYFAPDGMLWISTGDGGSGGDPNNNAQNINSLLGKMLRIDVNSTGTYNIPPDNPFVGANGADEIWSYGLRNAWKFSFDTTAGHVLIADVGQGQFEEINRTSITQAGVNYGWRCYEGNTTYNNTGCAPASTMTFPLAVYNHSGGKCSITGGYLYRGTEYPVFSGKYIFADYCAAQIGIMNTDGAITWSSAFTGNNFSTFGQDVNKELYVAAINNGQIYKITTTDLATHENQTESIKIHPNPARDKVFIYGLKGKGNTAEIISADGRLVLDGTIAEDGSLGISALKPGVYYITVKKSQLKIYTGKLMVK